MNDFFWQPRFANRAPSGGFGSRRQAMGQTAPAWKIRAETAVGNFDNLLRRISGIGDQGARDRLMSWVGNSSQPGTPAERYKAVIDDLSSGAVFTDITTKRVSDLEGVDAALESMVVQGEQAHAPTSQPDQPGTIVNFGGAMTPTGIVLVTLGLTGLLVVPFLLRE